MHAGGASGAVRHLIVVGEHSVTLADRMLFPVPGQWVHPVGVCRGSVAGSMGSIGGWLQGRAPGMCEGQHDGVNHVTDITSPHHRHALLQHSNINFERRPAAQE